MNSTENIYVISAHSKVEFLGEGQKVNTIPQSVYVKKLGLGFYNLSFSLKKYSVKPKEAFKETTVKRLRTIQNVQS